MSFFEFPHTRTYDSDLGWLIKDYETLNEAIAVLNTWKEETEPTIEDFKNLYNAITRGHLPEGMKEGMYTWLRANAADIVGDMIHLVIFNITDDGYFVAYIPESWNDIQFGTTGLDVITPLQPDYGHLVLSYDANFNAY